MVEHGHSTNFDSQPPFGELRLPTFVESFRKLANKLRGNIISRCLIALARHGCLSARPDPIDVDIFGNCAARLYPRSNQNEQRVFVGVKSWDAAERAALTAQMQAAPASQPFVFIDAGASGGLYSLYVVSEARRLGRAVRIIAIEPDPVNSQRLRFNIAASHADEITVAPVALGNHEDMGRLLTAQSGCGEVRLAHTWEASKTAIDVPVRPLHDILAEAGIAHVDALKLDVEGAEYPTLQALFAEAPESLWPALIILEVGKSERPTEAFRLCTFNGYSQKQRTPMNVLLTRRYEPVNFATNR